MKTRISVVAAAIFALALAADSFAVDGQIAINQAKAMAGGVTPGDAPGFPVTLSQPGSYILSSNITVPDGDTIAFVIAADHVTLDLNGFAIVGPADCSGGFRPCAGAGNGTGSGVATAGVYFNVTIRNGTIQGLGAGIDLTGDSHIVEHMQVRSNNSFGIRILASADQGVSTVRHNTVQRNGGFGISVRVGMVTHNASANNERGGIVVDAGMVSDNVATRNGIWGLELSGRTGYHHNSLFDNAGENVFGGVNLGDNLCNFTVCP